MFGICWDKWLPVIQSWGSILGCVPRILLILRTQSWSSIWWLCEIWRHTRSCYIQRWCFVDPVAENHRFCGKEGWTSEISDCLNPVRTVRHNSCRCTGLVEGAGLGHGVFVLRLKTFSMLSLHTNNSEISRPVCKFRIVKSLLSGCIGRSNAF